jgi:RNA polymerase sigma factor (sigma-70 family)
MGIGLRKTTRCDRKATIDVRVSSEPMPPPAQDPDATLLRQLVLARKRPDGVLREQLIMTRLLSRHVANIRRIVIWRAHSQRPSDADIDELVAGVLIRVAGALSKEIDASASIGGLIAVNVEWEVIDFVRRRMRRAPEVHPEIEDFPDPAAPERPTLADEARALRERIAGLSGRDQQIVAERMLLGLKPEEIAGRHGVRRQVVDTATSRALKKLQASDELSDVREARELRAARDDRQGRRRIDRRGGTDA